MSRWGLVESVGKILNAPEFCGIRLGSSFYMVEAWKPMGNDMKIQGGELTSTRLT